MTNTTATSAPGKILLGLIGKGIQQSMTPAMHEEEGRRQGLRVHYQLIDMAVTGAGIEDLPALVKSMRIIGFNGFNVTFPCKQAIIPFLDDLSEEARAMGAVNTVVNRNGKLIGHNTDGSGWSWGFKRALPDADLSKVVLLGGGGAGSAIADAALRMGVKHLIVADLDVTRTQLLVDKLNVQHGAGRASASADIAAALKDANGLIHATPTGMDKLPGLPLPAELLRADLWVSEIVYFPLETVLLKTARALGCPTSDGGGMAVGQAIGAFELFTGLKADVASIDAHFRSMVAARTAKA